MTPSNLSMPTLLPSEINYVREVASVEALFPLLVKKPEDLLLFFECACEDTVWVQAHTNFMKQTLSWFILQSFEDKLPLDYMHGAAKRVQEHFELLQPLILFNLSFKLKDAEIPINSLLFSAASDFFRELIRRECRDKHKKTLNFPEVSIQIFKPIQEFIDSGSSSHIWKFLEEEVMQILDLASIWGLDQLVEECQRSLKKYITRENAIPRLLMAHQQLWPIYKDECIEFINDLNLGIKMVSGELESFIFEFLAITERTLAFFQEAKNYITELIIGNFVDDPHFIELVHQCPRLKMLNISGSAALSDNFLELPKDLEQINLSQCVWLNEKTIRKITNILPYLKKIVLMSNVQLNYLAWGDLARFKQLTAVDLSRCHQVSDEDFIVILKACANVKELILDECKKIGDKGYFQLSKITLRLSNLDLSRCNISDLALVEISTRCRQLTHINLSRCENITEKGVISFVKHAHSLNQINLTRTEVPLIVIEEIKNLKPYLVVIY